MKGPIAHLLQTNPVIDLCHLKVAVSRATRPVMRMRWQESRQVPSEPPGAGQQWFSVCISSLPKHVLDCCWTLKPTQRMNVWSWCRFSLHLCFPLAPLLVTQPSSLSLFFPFLSCLLLSLCSCVSQFIQSSPFPFLIFTVCFQRDSNLADADWIVGQTLLSQIPSQKSHPFLTRKAH